MSDLNSTIIQESEPIANPQVKIDYSLYKRLKYLGIIHNYEEKDIRSFNVGNSDYSKHTIQPWAIWLDYPGLTGWDQDIIKRVLRNKKGESREMDYEKIIHNCEERLRQLKFSEYNIETT
jgi:hypothetical protein